MQDKILKSELYSQKN